MRKMTRPQSAGHVTATGHHAAGVSAETSCARFHKALGGPI
jgi:hypothetical protein